MLKYTFITMHIHQNLLGPHMTWTHNIYRNIIYFLIYFCLWANLTTAVYVSLWLLTVHAPLCFDKEEPFWFGLSFPHMITNSSLKHLNKPQPHLSECSMYFHLNFFTFFPHFYSVWLAIINRLVISEWLYTQGDVSMKNKRGG